LPSGLTAIDTQRQRVLQHHLLHPRFLHCCLICPSSSHAIYNNCLENCVQLCRSNFRSRNCLSSAGVIGPGTMAPGPPTSAGLPQTIFLSRTAILSFEFIIRRQNAPKLCHFKAQIYFFSGRGTASSPYPPVGREHPPHTAPIGAYGVLINQSINQSGED